jgi:hydroxymethylbilane synthase
MGARGSLLSRAQSGAVADALEKACPGLKVEVVIVRTTGDHITDRPLHLDGGKGLFTKELEHALLDGVIDIAVHSFKDVPVTMPLVDQTELVIAAVPKREDARDVLVTVDGRPLDELRLGARVATGSLRRRCQVLDYRRDLRVEPLRGNVDTRLRKLLTDGYDGILLACAGLHRSGLFDAKRMSPMDLDEMIPAAGQGALAIQCRRGDAGTRELVSVLNDAETELCARVERAVILKLRGDCHSPIASLATVEGDRIRLRTAVGRRDGEPPVIRAMAVGDVKDPDKVLTAVTASLERQGAHELLHSEPPLRKGDVTSVSAPARPGQLN